MNPIIERLQSEAQLTQEQATKAYAVIINIIKEKVPFGFGDKVESILSGKSDLGSVFSSHKSDNETSKNEPKSSNPLDKLNDFMKGL